MAIHINVPNICFSSAYCYLWMSEQVVDVDKTIFGT